MANIGYSRVSTTDQNLDLQLDALREAGCTRVYQDKASGATMDRPELQKALERVEEGDTLIVWKLDRLGRNTIQCLTLLQDLRDRGVTFRSVTEGLQTTGAMGKAMTTMLMAFAEMERDFNRERILAGIEAARARGATFGRPVPAHLEAEARRVLALAEKGNTRREIAAILGVSRATVLRRAAWARTNL